MRAVTWTTDCNPLDTWHTHREEDSSQEVSRVDPSQRDYILRFTIHALTNSEIVTFITLWFWEDEKVQIS